MKKFLSIALCAVMILGSVSAFAENIEPEIKFLTDNGYLKGREGGLELESNVTRAEALTMLLRVCDEENAAMTGEKVVDYETITGEFVGKEENGIVINTQDGAVLINTENAIFRGDAIEEIKEGALVSAVVSKMRTRSIPAQTEGILVVVSDITSVKAIEVAEVVAEDGAYSIYSKDGEYIVVASNETMITPYKTRNILSIEDLSEGDELFVLTDVMTMSIPAQVMPNEIIVFANEFAQDEVAEITEFATIAGTYVREEENGIVINTENGEVLINTENTIFRGNDIAEIKEGNMVSALVSAHSTMSLPPMVQGYLVVVSEMTSVKVIDIQEVNKEDEVYKIVSQDGEYIVVADENTPVSPYKTRNILRVQDLSKGDKIFVLSDVMTMSIPAQIMANEIIVFENEFSENEEVKEEKEFKDTIGHWAEKIIKYSYNKGYVNGESEDCFNPEGNVKGREMVKMMLSKFGEESVTIENAFELAKNCGLLDDETLDSVIENNEELTREEISKLCYKFIMHTNPEMENQGEIVK